MNLTAEWCDVLYSHGITAAHWSTIGDPRDPDSILLDWARRNDYVVFTHDLDFGTLLALTHANGPSVIQVRGQDVLPGSISNVVVSTIRSYSEELSRGAIIVIEADRARVRILPL